ncbi:ragulator complex protein LAMTOR4 homolog [Anastrepha obliqua]|uniref:ragulator complex protein LAMTOR4 homolog n=1 Tax=Anastrepha ludens TaxID=28586 RepID=UPI0023B0AE79|nr:ragulator complex protein LAMTOR4 homolog [Anastrepha ludens]XP_054732020.1 ragulator complex protein LAMTOR4 homolog [Anastrepha obliqua]
MTLINRMEKLCNQIGYLVLQDDGAVIESGGDLENDERSANIFLDLLNLAESVDDNFMPNNSCERISIVYDDHSYNISMSNHRIFIVKLKNVARGNAGYSSASNGSSVVFAENESTVVTSVLA